MVILYNFYKNNLKITCDRISQRKQEIGVLITISNNSYYLCGECIASYIINYNSINSIYNYVIDIGLFNSLLLIRKDEQSRSRILKLQIELNDVMYYSYFIYNKYYTFVDKNYFITNSISSKKLFNCRDYYKIYSYI
jgi:hypothetical protein